ncbi:MAG: hypothetical protein D6735_05170 [Acidobacteria bacterium]|jgi:hypothetical protein|nr:MAG: hypothetical protein D6735_05170 [Acidobacteriota bacterium]
MGKPARYSHQASSTLDIYKAELKYIFSKENISLEEISEETGISKDVIRHQSAKHNWVQKRRALQYLIRDRLFLNELRAYFKDIVVQNNTLDLLEISLKKVVGILYQKTIELEMEQSKDIADILRSINEAVRIYQAIETEKTKELQLLTELKHRIQEESSSDSLQMVTEDELKELVAKYINQLIEEEADAK